MAYARVHFRKSDVWRDVPTTFIQSLDVKKIKFDKLYKVFDSIIPDDNPEKALKRMSKIPVVEDNGEMLEAAYYRATVSRIADTLEDLDKGKRISEVPMRLLSNFSDGEMKKDHNPKKKVPKIDEGDEECKLSKKTCSKNQENSYSFENAKSKNPKNNNLSKERVEERVKSMIDPTQNEKRLKKEKNKKKAIRILSDSSEDTDNEKNHESQTLKEIENLKNNFKVLQGQNVLLEQKLNDLRYEKMIGEESSRKDIEKLREKNSKLIQDLCSLRSEKKTFNIVEGLQEKNEKIQENQSELSPETHNEDRSNLEEETHSTEEKMEDNNLEKIPCSPDNSINDTETIDRSEIETQNTGVDESDTETRTLHEGQKIPIEEWNSLLKKHNGPHGDSLFTKTILMRIFAHEELQGCTLKGRLGPKTIIKHKSTGEHLPQKPKALDPQKIDSLMKCLKEKIKLEVMADSRVSDDAKDAALEAAFKERTKKFSKYVQDK